MNRILRRIKTVFWELITFKLGIVGHIPSHYFRRFCYRLCGIKIGSGSAIHMNAVFYYPPNIKIGEDSIIGERAVLDGRAPLSIGNHVDIASEVMIYNAEHNISEEDFADVEKSVKEPVVIEDYVFIGPRAIILPGVTLKKGAVVGAGAVVTKDVEEFKIVGGVPAREIGERQNKNPNYKLGRAAWFR
jgi:maltose O-acetyltransferase